MVNIRKRGKVYQYQFEIAKVEGKRKYISKSGFKTKNEALMAGIKAYDELPSFISSIVNPLTNPPKLKNSILSLNM